MQSVLTLNVGSATLKYGVYSLDEHLTRHQFGNICYGQEEELASAIETLADKIDFETTPICVHRIVHGGQFYSEPVLIDDEVLAKLDTLTSLAPLHLPPALKALEAIQRRFPSLKHLACFDTAFHTTQAPMHTRFPIHHQWHEKGLRRFGFHGLSYQYISQQIPEIIPLENRERVVVAHLGNGSSVCAMKDGVSVATSMGFSALGGIMMGTRSGDLDPGVLLHLLESEKFSVKALNDELYNRSGLLGVSGISKDMRELEASNDPRAAEAIELYCYRAAAEIAALCTAIGGIDSLVFTAGIGENSALAREKIVQQLDWLELRLDRACNARHELCVSPDRVPKKVFVIATNEEYVMAEAARTWMD